MHIRDENLCNKTKMRLKRKFTTCTHLPTAADAPAATPLLPLTLNPSLLEPPTTSQDKMRTCSSSVGAGSFNEEHMADFQAIVDHHTKLVDEDDHNNDSTSILTTLQHPIIVNLFDFTIPLGQDVFQDATVQLRGGT